MIIAVGGPRPLWMPFHGKMVLGFKKVDEHESEHGASCGLSWFLLQVPALTTARATKLQQYAMVSFYNMLSYVYSVL